MSPVKVTVRDLGLKRIQKEIEASKKAHVNVGVLSTAGTYATDEGPVNLADVATFNEFGTHSIPARPFMAQAFDKNVAAIKSFVAKRLDDVHSGKGTALGGLKLIGEFFKGKVQETISNGDFEPNAPATLAAKYPKTRPLIDTGRLRGSINYEVKPK